MKRGKPKIALSLLRAQTKALASTTNISPAELKQQESRRSRSSYSGSSAGSLQGRQRSGSSSVGFNFKDRGNFYHLPSKDSRYTHEHKYRTYHHESDPFFYVDVATDCETFFMGQKARAQQTKTEHFAYIVDLDNYEYHKVVFHSFLNEILQSSFFRYSILTLVLINSVLIGLATLVKLKAYQVIFDLIDMIILSVFIFEIIIKWIYDFRLFWTVFWNCLDFFIISLTMMAAVIPMADQGESAAIAVRVVRTFRSLRCVSSMTSLSIVTHTVIKSGLDMGNILLVLIIFMLVLSVMAVILFDIEDLAPQRFLNALDAWVVLFICVTQDGWAEVLNSYERSSRYFIILALYLIFAVSVGAFVFANLIVAVIVANLELSVKELRMEMKIHDNPLEFHGTYLQADVEIIPVYDLLAKNNFVCIAQRPMKIPRLKKLSARRIQVYVSLVCALEQNMLEAEIISVDLEKIIAVLLSIIVQIDVNTGNIAKKEREEALAKLTKLSELLKSKRKNPNYKPEDGDINLDDFELESTLPSQFGDTWPVSDETRPNMASEVQDKISPAKDIKKGKGSKKGTKKIERGVGGSDRPMDKNKSTGASGSMGRNKDGIAAEPVVKKNA